MKKSIMWCFAFFIGLVSLSFNNCSEIRFRDGSSTDRLRSLETITGNPLSQAAKTLLTVSCDIVTRCHQQVTLEQCETGLLKTSGIDYQLGLPKGSVNEFSEIIQSESSGNLLANPSGYNSCLSAIEKLSCSDSAVQAAYDPMANNPYAGMAFMIPTSPGSCPSMYNQPQARREYYVASHGSDSNDGSQSRPWATLNHASQALVPGAEGAIVHVAPGTYNLSPIANCPTNGSSCGVRTTRSGTGSAPITYISDQQWGARLIASGSNFVWYNSGDHVRIIGFEIVGTTSSDVGILSEGSFGQLVGNHIHSIPATTGCTSGTGGAGIRFGWDSNSTDNDALGNLIHDIGPFPGNGQPSSAYCGSLFHGISYTQPRGRVHNNIIYRTGTWGISTTHSASNMIITNNLVFNSGARTNNGISIGGGILVSAQTAPHDNTTVANNILRNNSGHSITEWDSVGNRNVYFNNITYSNGMTIQVFGGGQVQGTLTADPQMIDFRINGGGNYRLASSSPAINAGTLNCAPGVTSCTPYDDYTGLARPFGSALDLGPYEWHP